VPAYVTPGGTGASCGMAVIVIGPEHPDYPRYATVALARRDDLPGGAGDVARFAAREAVEDRRTVALIQPDGSLLLPPSEWARGVYELTPDGPGYERWAASAITEREWESRSGVRRQVRRSA
jgi:hypothetical protein